MVPTKDGIEIELTVSTGLLMTKIPDVVNKEYREATIELEKLGFVVEVEIVQSDSITKDYVVSTNPEAGEQIPAGAKIYLFVSGGADIDEVPMPNLVGKTKYDAVATLNSIGLSVGSVTAVDNSTYDKDVVVWQNVKAGEKLAKGSVVYLQISKGPSSTPTPTATPSATPSPSPSPSPSETVTPDGEE